MFSSMKCLLITIIVLDNILKLRLELITLRNDNVTEEFYRIQVVLKVVIFGRNFENFKKS